MTLGAILAGKDASEEQRLLLGTVTTTASGTPLTCRVQIDGSDTAITAITGRIVFAGDRVAVTRIGSQMYVVIMPDYKQAGRGAVNIVTATATVGPYSGSSASPTTLLTKQVDLVAGHYYELMFTCYGTTFMISGDQFEWLFGLTNASALTNPAHYMIASTGAEGTATTTSSNVWNGINMHSLWVATATGPATMSMVSFRVNGTSTASTRATATSPMALWIKDVTP